jgi:fibrillarin-like pre-rRNA processing protein
VTIALRNCLFLKKGGAFILMLKTRSVDVRREPDLVFRETLVQLGSGGLVVSESMWLTPYHHDHAAIVCTKE